MKKLMEILLMVLPLIKETGWDGLIWVLPSFSCLKHQNIFDFKLIQEIKYVLVNHYSQLYNYTISLKLCFLYYCYEITI